jgi:hypothetical protein
MAFKNNHRLLVSQRRQADLIATSWWSAGCFASPSSSSAFHCGPKARLGEGGQADPHRGRTAHGKLTPDVNGPENFPEICRLATGDSARWQ